MTQEIIGYELKRVLNIKEETTGNRDKFVRFSDEESSYVKQAMTRFEKAQEILSRKFKE